MPQGIRMHHIIFGGTAGFHPGRCKLTRKVNDIEAGALRFISHNIFGSLIRVIISIHHPNREDANQSRQAELDVAITPLAMPILAGPGTIATAMNFVSDGGLTELAITATAFFVLCVITYFFFIFGERFVKYIGVNGIKVITRLMGLILAVIGTQMVIVGAVGAITAFQAGEYAAKISLLPLLNAVYAGL